jgi:hypothetical protein
MRAIGSGFASNLTVLMQDCWQNKLIISNLLFELLGSLHLDVRVAQTYNIGRDLITTAYAIYIFLADLDEGLSFPPFGLARKLFLEIAPGRYDLDVLRIYEIISLGHEQLAAVLDPTFCCVCYDEGLAIFDRFLQ